MAAQEINTSKIQNYTQAISANIANLLAEVSRVSAVQTAPPPPSPSPNTTININNNNGNFDEILCQLQNITSELVGLRRDVDSMKGQLGQDRSNSSSNDRSQQQTTEITQLNLEELMELKDSWMPSTAPETANWYNKSARRYNSGLRDSHEYLAPLYSSRNNQVFGFPGTVGELNKLNHIAEKLLCGAFGLEYVKNAQVFATFCGVDSELLHTFARGEMNGNEIAFCRVMTRGMRAYNIAKAGDPTPETRRAAALHNSTARLHNAAITPNQKLLIMPLRDERNLEVQGFPKTWRLLSKAQRTDVLWYLGEYGLDVAEEGCLERLEEYLGIPRAARAERGMGWLL